MNLLGEIVAVSLGTGIGKKWLCLITLLVCSLGTQKGDSEAKQNGRSVRRRGTCSGYAYVSPGCGTGKMGSIFRKWYGIPLSQEEKFWKVDMM